MIQRNINTPLVFRLGMVLLAALFVTCNMIGGFYARYSISVMDSATVSVARFDVDTSCVYDPETDRYILTAVKDSEGSGRCSVLFTVDGAEVPEGVAVTLNNAINGTVIEPGGSVSAVLSFSEGFNSYHEDLAIDIVVNISQVD